MNAARATARQQLRAATAPGHARVDALFADGLQQPRDYRRYLRGMHALVADIDAALQAASMSAAWRDWRHPARLHWLRADLDALGLAPLPPGPGLVIAGDAGVAGALYVLEGSMLGARTLLADACRLGWSSRRGAAFLHGHAGDATGQRWRRFLGQLEDADFGGDGAEALLAAAAATFASAEHEFRRATHLDPGDA